MVKAGDRTLDVALVAPQAEQDARAGDQGDQGASAASTYLNGLGGGRRTQRSALRGLAVLLGYRTPFEVPWSTVTAQDVRQLRARLRTLYAGGTVNRWLSALRGVLKSAQGYPLPAALQEELRGSEFESGVPAGRTLGMLELAKLLGAGRPNTVSTRDVAMIAVMYGSGLRRDSIAKLDVADWDGSSTLTTRKAKGGHTYVAALHSSMRPFLVRWMELRGSDNGPLFPRALPTGKMTRARLSVQAISDAIERLRVRAGVQPFTPHDLRRTFGTELLASGADIVAAAKLMGHEDVKTTMRYDRRAPERLAELVEKMPDPTKASSSE